MAKIKIIFIDIEGTLTHSKLELLNMQYLDKIQKLSHQATKIGIDLTLSTGRPQPYVESILQIINGQTWAVCENGAVFYNMKLNQSAFNDHIPNDYYATKHEIEILLKHKIEKKFNGWSQELGKEFIISINQPKDQPIEPLFKHIQELLSPFTQKIEITHSKNAVDIAPKGISKMDGIKWVLIKTGIKKEETAGIGDSLNDLEMLQFVEMPGAPSNADDNIKKVVAERQGFISNKQDTLATYEFIKYCLKL